MSVLSCQNRICAWICIQLNLVWSPWRRYNDHHFHYGYMIYAAAIVAKNRPEWGREYYDRVLLYIRDIANPSSEDGHFPMFRQKDWYLGNSWAGGLMSSKCLALQPPASLSNHMHCILTTLIVHSPQCNSVRTVVNKRVRLKPLLPLKELHCLVMSW